MEGAGGSLSDELRALEKGLSAKRASHQEHAKGNRYVSRKEPNDEMPEVQETH